MTFSEFKSAVIEGLGPDGQRSGGGTSGLDNFRLRAICNAMIDLQRFIIGLRVHHSDTIEVASFTPDGRASKGSIQAGCKPVEFWIIQNKTIFVKGAWFVQFPNGITFYASASTDGAITAYSSSKNDSPTVELRFVLANDGFWYYQQGEYGGLLYASYYRGLDTDGTPAGIAFQPYGSPPGSSPAPTVTAGTSSDCNRYKLESFSWDKRHDLICGNVPDSFYAYAISPDRKSYIVHPAINAATTLNLVWSGIKTSWVDGDELTDAWDDAVAECVAEYVKSRIIRQYDKDSVARSDRHYQDYMRLRRAIYLDLQEVG